MKVLRNLTAEESIALDINRRVGALLRQERTNKARSIRSVARKLKIRRESLKRWEAGLSSPPANRFHSIVCFYGKAAYTRAVELDFQLQQEKYARACLKSQIVVQLRKVPAVIWVEESQFLAAA